MRPVVTIGQGIGEIDAELVHSWLHHDAYWSRGITWDQFVKAFANSVVISARLGTQQVGIARIVSDQATFAWLCDLFVHPEHRHQGIAGSLVETARGLSRQWGVRRVLLATRDAHPLYDRFGFRPVAPTMFMELGIAQPDLLPAPEDP